MKVIPILAASLNPPHMMALAATAGRPVRLRIDQGLWPAVLMTAIILLNLYCDF